MTGPEHPFFHSTYQGMNFYYTCAEDRIAQVKQMDAAKIERVLQLDNLQTTVRRAAEVRLRKLERAAFSATGIG